MRSLDSYFKNTLNNDCGPPVILSIVATAFALLRLGFHDWGAGLYTPYTGSDADYYLHYAWMIAFVDPEGGQLKHIIPPSPYICLLIAAYKIAGPQLIGPYLLNSLLYVTTVWFVYGLTRNLFDRRTGVIAGAITCLCGPLVFFAGLTMKTIAIAAFLAPAGYFLERYVSRRRLRDLVCFSVFATLVTMERNNLLLFAPALVLLIALPRAPIRTVAARTTILIGTIALTVFLVARPFADAHSTSPLGTNFYIGNSDIATGAYTLIPNIRNDLIGHHTDMYEHAEEQAGEPLSTLEADLWWIQRTTGDAVRDPAGFVRLMGRKTLMMFSAYSPDAPNRYRLWRRHDPFLAAAVFDYGLVLALALPGIVFAWRRNQRRRWIAGHLFVTAVYAATVVAFFVLERYRIVVLIALIPFAAYTLSLITRKHRSKLIVTVLAIYALTHLLNLANPHGPGWRPVNDQARERLTEMRKDNLEVYRYKVDAIEQNSLKAWDRLAYHYYKRNMKGDGELFLQKYNELKFNKKGSP